MRQRWSLSIGADRGYVNYLCSQSFFLHSSHFRVVEDITLRFLLLTFGAAQFELTRRLLVSYISFYTLKSHVS